MQIFNLLIGVLWFSFWIYWLVSAIGKKKVIKRANSGQRFTFIIFVIILLTLSHLPYFHVQPFTSNNIILTVGVILCALGLGFAVWARVHLGSNWNAEPSIQQGHELVTSGPYQWVRHPIYTGLIIALFGSTLVGNAVWLVIFIALGFIFVWRIKTEEKFMMELFPQAYPEYKKRTKALFPFIW